MTQEIFNEIVKAKKLNTDHFDKIKAWINPAYTYIYITIGTHECVGGKAKLVELKSFKLSIASILKKGKHLPEEYETSVYGDFTWSLK